MTLQDVFNKTVAHLLMQNAKAVDKDGNCLYKAEDGKMCAVGCLFSNAWYDEETLEHAPVQTAQVSFALEQSGVPMSEKMSSLLRDLQTVHDNSLVSDWAEELHRVAVYYKLTMPEVPK